MPERDERLYLDDIVQAIDRILIYTSEGREAFFADSRTQDAVIRNLEIIGEAIRVSRQPPGPPTPRFPGSRSRARAIG